jgi:hypothetical protein
MAGSEIFGFVVMVAGAYALICWFAFTLRNLPDALDNTSDDIAYGDWPKVPAEFRGVKARAEMAGRGSGACEREPSVIKQSHNQVPASHSGTGA